MKIIDNKKDYYDYVSGVYGIDPYVVYDRRGSVASSEIIYTYGEMFDKNPVGSDTFPDNRKYGRHVKDKAFIDKDFTIVVEAGDSHYHIKCNRRRETEDSPIELTYRLYDPMDELRHRYRGQLDDKTRFWMQREIDGYRKKKSKSPLAIFIYGQRYAGKPYEIENPILKGLPITGLIPAEEIWKNIYDYLLKMKEPVIVDRRTNNEHIESAGFDKKKSFRKM